MREVLLTQLDRENNKLNRCGDTLLTIKVDNYDFHNYMAYLDLMFEFDYIAEALSDVHRVVLVCTGNKELLKKCIGSINEISFIVSSFTVKVSELQKALLWKN